MRAPSVTVYITNHNYGDYVAQAVRSVLAQTLQDFELLIIDDGSTDNSRSIIEGFAEHPKVSIIFQQNQGLNVTNNIAFRAARGRYIMRLDADDYLDPHALEVLAGILDRDPNAGLVFPDYVTVDREGTPLDVVRRHDFEEVRLFDQPAHGACTLVRVSALAEIGGYDESYRCQDGWDLWVRLREKFRVRNVNLPLFYYRQHGENLTGNEQRLLDTRAQILRKQRERTQPALQALALVPVRGPTIDPRSRALETLGDRLLVDWTVEAALESETVHEVAVTSPDEAVLRHIKARYGGAVHALQREASLAMLNTHLEATVRSSLEQLGAARSEQAKELPEALAVLTVESPFRRGHHVDAAFDALSVFDADCVIGVRPELDSFFRHEGAGLIPVRRGQSLRLEAEELFRRVGHFVVFRRQHLEVNARMVSGRVGHVVLEPTAAFALNSPTDWNHAQWLASEQQPGSDKVPAARSWMTQPDVS